MPPGHHGWAEPGAAPDLRPYVDLLRLGDGQPIIDDPDEAAPLVRATLPRGVRMRVDTDLTVGVVLSGGLDSSLTLPHVREMHPDCVAFTVGTEGSEDLAYARRLAADLGVPHEVVELRPRDIRLADVREAIRVCELTEYGDIINAVVSVPLFRRVRASGVKVVLTGDGSDELFGGYPMYHQVGADAVAGVCSSTRSATCAGPSCNASTGPAWATASRRGCRSSTSTWSTGDAAAGVDLKLRDGQEKWIVRQAFADVLPDYIRERRRTRCRTRPACTSGPGSTSRSSPGSTARSATTRWIRCAGTSGGCCRTRPRPGPRDRRRRERPGLHPGRARAGGGRRREVERHQRRPRDEAPADHPMTR